MTVGVILHIHNPTPSHIEAVAVAAETAGADWVGVADAFWWRDTWLLLARAAAVTAHIGIGPVVTNPYLRHPFHTVAALATLQELAGNRVLLGLGAGGSEVGLSAKVDRRDAARRIIELAELTRAVAAEGPLDPVTGRRLDLDLLPVPIIVAGRGNGVLRASGLVGDQALLQGIPHSDLTRAVDVIRQGAAGRVDARSPTIIWTPLVEHDSTSHATSAVAYPVLNSSSRLHDAWGLSSALVEQIRTVAVTSGNAAASALVPDSVLPDYVLGHDEVARAATIAAGVGVTGIAVRATSPDVVPAAVEWARAVLARANDEASPA